MRKKSKFSLYILLSIAACQPIEARPSSFISGLIVGVCALFSGHVRSSGEALAEAPIWSAGEGDLYRVGNVTQLNAVYEESQEAPALCKLAGGGIASAWQTYAWDSDLWGVSLRIFSDDLAPLTDDIRVNTEVSGSQLAPSIACKVDGGLEVWWVSGGQDGDGDGIYRQRFNATGGRIGGEERVNSATTGDQSSPCVAARTTGGSVGVFESNGGNGYDIYTRFYSANGTAEGVEARVNTYTADYQRRPVVTVLENGHVLYLWESEQPGSGNDIHGCIYTDEGVPFRGEFRLNNYTSNDQLFPANCPLSRGYAAGWSSLLQDGSSFGVYVGKYDEDNQLIRVVRVNTQTEGTQSWPALSYLPSIGILVTWTGLDGFSYGIYGQLLTEELEPIGQEFLINIVTAGAQSDSTSVYIGDGTMVVAFQSNDGDSYGIFAQKLAFLTQAPTVMPTGAPSYPPSLAPTGTPSFNPSLAPSMMPTDSPSGIPTGTPTGQPTPSPSKKPTGKPSFLIIPNPSYRPTSIPSSPPTHGAENKVSTPFTTTSQPRKEPNNSVSLHEEEGFISEIFVYSVIGCGLILCCLIICYCIYRDYRKNVYIGKSINTYPRQSSSLPNQMYNHAQQASYAPVNMPLQLPIQPKLIPSPQPHRLSSAKCLEGKQQNNCADGQYIFEDMQNELNQQYYINSYPVNEMQIYPHRQSIYRKKSLYNKQRKRHVSVPSQSANNFTQSAEIANRFPKDDIDDIDNDVIDENDIATGDKRETQRKTDENVLPENDNVEHDMEVMGDSDHETMGNTNENVLPEDGDEKDNEGSNESELLLPHTNDDDYEESEEEEDDESQDNDDTMIINFINNNAELSDDESHNDNKGKDFVALDSTPM